MKSTSIVRDLVKVLECQPMKYTEMQDYIFYHPSRKTILTSSRSRGYWCTSINKLVRNGVIYKNKDDKYVTSPGSSNDYSFF